MATTPKQVNRKTFPWTGKRVDRIVIPPDKVREVLAPWVYKVLLRIKREEAMKQKQAQYHQGGSANGYQG